MNSVIGSIASYFVNAVWEIALIACAGWLASRVLKRLGPQTEHVIWVSTLILAVVAPALSVLRRPLAMLIVPQAMGQHSSTILIPTQRGVMNSGGVYAPFAGILWFILAFCCCSALYFAARLIRSLYGTAMLVRHAVPLSLSPQQEEIWDRCKRSFLLDTVRIRTSFQVTGPVVLGLRTPVLLLPAEFAGNCTYHDFFAALAHECAHIKRRDFQKNLLYEAISLIFAFHPVIWVLKSQIAQTREIVCDGLVTEMMDSRSYARSLLRLAAMVVVSSRTAGIRAIGIFDANILEKRIMKMSLKKQHVSTISKCALIASSMLFLLSVAIGASAMVVTFAPQSPTQIADQTGPYGHVYKIGKGVTAPILIKSQEAKFPKSGHYAKGFHAIVMIQIIVDAKGMPRDAHVVRSYNKNFDAEAMKAVRQYRFKPAMRLGKPVAVSAVIEVNFKKY